MSSNDPDSWSDKEWGVRVGCYLKRYGKPNTPEDVQAVVAAIDAGIITLAKDGEIVVCEPEVVVIAISRYRKRKK